MLNCHEVKEIFKQLKDCKRKGDYQDIQTLKITAQMKPYNYARFVEVGYRSGLESIRRRYG